MMILLSLLAGAGYALAALFFKTALRGGINLWHVVGISNIVLGFVFLVPWFSLHGSLPMQFSAAACAAGSLFFVGQLLNVIAIAKGDVSVATPMLGVKVLLVAVFSAVLINERISWQIWLGGVLTFIAVILLQGRFQILNRRILGCVALAFLSCVAYALVDVITQKHASQQPSGEFLVQTYSLNALLSLVFLPGFLNSVRPNGYGTWISLGGGSLVYAGAVAGISYSIANFGNATLVNILYASRGLWSVFLVWAVGKSWAEAKEMATRMEMLCRLSACILIIGAILLALSRH